MTSHLDREARQRKRDAAFERDQRLTPTKRVQLGFRLSERARAMRRSYLVKKSMKDYRP